MARGNRPNRTGTAARQPGQRLIFGESAPPRSAASLVASPARMGATAAGQAMTAPAPVQPRPSSPPAEGSKATRRNSSRPAPTDLAAAQATVALVSTMLEVAQEHLISARLQADGAGTAHERLLPARLIVAAGQALADPAFRMRVRLLTPPTPAPPTPAGRADEEQPPDEAVLDGDAAVVGGDGDP